MDALASTAIGPFVVVVVVVLAKVKVALSFVYIMELGLNGSYLVLLEKWVLN